MTVSERSLSIVLPVHQQADHIEAVLAGLHDAVAELCPSVEVIVVVNASTDGSADRCRAVDRPGIQVIELAERGWGRAVRAGLRSASGEVVCFTNAARTTPQDLRTAVVLALTNAGSATKAVRRTRNSIVRRTGSVLYNFEARALFGLASWDVNGTPKVFPREFSALFELREDGDLLDLEWLVTCDRAGYPIVEYPVTSVRRHGGRSTTRARSALHMYMGAIGLRRRLKGRPAPAVT
jgi:glycosyltransferase involved in cell wall biosynthesis